MTVPDHERPDSSGATGASPTPSNRLKTALIRLGREVLRYVRARGLNKKIAAAFYLLLDALRTSRNTASGKTRRDEQGQRAAALRTLGLSL